jgi:hypothetical protein
MVEIEKGFSVIEGNGLPKVTPRFVSLLVEGSKMSLIPMWQPFSDGRRV